MHREVMHLLLDHMRNLETGVNACLDVLPITTIAAPRHVAWFGSEYSDLRVRKREAPPDFPALVLTSAGPVTTDAELSGGAGGVDARDGLVPLNLRIIEEASVGADDIAAGQTMVLLRATVRSLAHFADRLHAETDTTVDGVKVSYLHSLAYGPWREEPVGSSGRVAAIIALTVAARDYEA